MVLDSGTTFQNGHYVVDAGVEPSPQPGTETPSAPEAAGRLYRGTHIPSGAAIWLRVLGTDPNRPIPETQRREWLQQLADLPSAALSALPSSLYGFEDHGLLIWVMDAVPGTVPSLPLEPTAIATYLSAIAPAVEACHDQTLPLHLSPGQLRVTERHTPNQGRQPHRITLVGLGLPPEQGGDSTAHSPVQRLTRLAAWLLTGQPVADPAGLTTEQVPAELLPVLHQGWTADPDLTPWLLAFQAAVDTIPAAAAVVISDSRADAQADAQTEPGAETKAEPAEAAEPNNAPTVLVSPAAEPVTTAPGVTAVAAAAPPARPAPPPANRPAPDSTSNLWWRWPLALTAFAATLTGVGFGLAWRMGPVDETTAGQSRNFFNPQQSFPPDADWPISEPSVDVQFNNPTWPDRTADSIEESTPPVSWDDAAPAEPETISPPTEDDFSAPPAPEPRPEPEPAPTPPENDDAIAPMPDPEPPSAPPPPESAAPPPLDLDPVLPE